MIYLDNSATTRPCPEAVAAVTNALTDNWANPSALYQFGFDSARLLREARQKVAAALGAEPDRVFFTSGGTEADNWAIFSTAKRYGHRNKHIITTAIEHPAVLNCMKDLELQGFEVTYLQPDADGRILPADLKAALRSDTILVSIMMVNNEAGSVMPIAQMAKLTHKLSPNAIFHTDAVQGFLKIPFSAKQLGADLITISSHKIHGPKGAGALYISPRLKSFPSGMIGGGQESGYRSVHVVIAVPVYLVNKRKMVPVEIQFRSVMMDAWASLEHELRYKNKGELTPDITNYLKTCAETLHKVDEQMSRVRHEVLKNDSKYSDY